MKPLLAALAYANAGLPVFPCWPILPAKNPADGFICGCGRLDCTRRGKHPMGNLARHGLSDASTNSGIITEWWTSRPDANIAIATGAMIVLDVDPRHNGDASLAELERKHGALPKTRRARSGSGGEHVYFRPPANITVRNSVSGIAPGLDIRGSGGYAIAPPSRHESGNYYEWISIVPAAEMPMWLAALVEKPVKSAKPAGEWRDLVRQGVTEGQRNNSIAQLAGHLLRHRIDAVATLELLTCWNLTRCKPPLTPEEVETVVNNIAGRELKRRGET